ncbi:tetratricopeptide repeat protein [Pacificibacter marinus]|uniref:Tetratricopeptide repeat protein n=1 Tax=Pacificibacter marinus TaxID=658057 RepID=A0A1Y5RH02_9RHOB|nr:tetratricopeptide repeat protein [Pacificibacter marinus]SEK19523.1 TPR repeat-containing protein [Pacificibacter marinus]SLN17140.1 Tetratricopeptide repeat protein [Pacificibacter marinus]
MHLTTHPTTSPMARDLSFHSPKPAPLSALLPARAILIAGLALAILAGCGDQNRLSPLKKGGVYAPTGVKFNGQSVDGLTVGHRLMASGEYELALRAYLRAAGTRGLDVDVMSAIGSANLKLGRLGQAEKILRRAVKLDETFVPAWNNLGVVLMEQRNYGEAERVFRMAFALDSGQSAEIRDNLRLALAKLKNPDTILQNESDFTLVRRGTGDYLILAR